jgi:hypothetical protein
MSSEIDGMLQSLYMMNNAPMKREGHSNPADIGSTPDAGNPTVDALPFQVTVKSHAQCTARVWRDHRPVGEVLSPTVEMTGGVSKYSYKIAAEKSIQTYFKKQTSTTGPFDLRVLYVDKDGQEDAPHTVPITDGETETAYPIELTGHDVEGWNIYHTDRLILQIRFHA